MSPAYNFGLWILLTQKIPRISKFLIRFQKDFSQDSIYNQKLLQAVVECCLKKTNKQFTHVGQVIDSTLIV